MELLTPYHRMLLSSALAQTACPRRLLPHLALASSTFLCRIRPQSSSRGAQCGSVQPRHSGTHHKQSGQDWANWCLIDLAQLLFRWLLLPTICILLGNTNHSTCPFLAFVLTLCFLISLQPPSPILGECNQKSPVRV